MTPDEIEKEFEKFFAASPFISMGDRFKLAMKGSYLAGWTLLAERLKAVYKPVD